jgi:hypothetical protein
MNVFVVESGALAEQMNDNERAVTSYDKVLAHNPCNVVALTRYVVNRSRSLSLSLSIMPRSIDW